MTTEQQTQLAKAAPRKPRRISDYVEGRTPVGINFRGSFSVGPASLNGSWSEKNDRQWTVEVDDERRVVWLMLDQGGQKRVGWLPFESVVYITWGLVEEPGPKAVA